MKAAIIKSFGSSKEFIIDSNYPIPRVGKNQVLIKVHGTSVNPLDYKTREGVLRIFLGSKFPMVLGNDVSGEVVSCGKSVTKFKVGDRVYGILDGNIKSSYWGFAKPGTYGEFAVTREDTLATIPESLSYNEAGVIPLCFLTAYQGIVAKGGVKNKSRVLINGASGGVGVFAVKIAKFYGAHVTAVCSSKSIGKVKYIGADDVVDYKESDIKDINRKFDIIYDIAANRKFKELKHLLNPKGTFISNLAPLFVFIFPLLRRIKKIGRYAFVWVEPSGKELERLSGIVESIDHCLITDKSYTLDNISEAHDYCENSKPFGKVSVLVKQLH